MVLGKPLVQGDRRRNCAPLEQPVGWENSSYSQTSCASPRQMMAIQMSISVNSIGETTTDFHWNTQNFRHS